MSLTSLFKFRQTITLCGGGNQRLVASLLSAIESVLPIPRASPSLLPVSPAARRTSSWLLRQRTTRLCLAAGCQLSPLLAASTAAIVFGALAATIVDAAASAIAIAPFFPRAFETQPILYHIQPFIVSNFNNAQIAAVITHFCREDTGGRILTGNHSPAA